MKEPLSNMGRVCRTCLPPKPTATEIANVMPGDFVKIVRGGERFWSRVGSRYDDLLVSTINNDLLNTDKHGLHDADVIGISVNEVIQIMKAGA